jgi:hypothetical protein
MGKYKTFGSRFDRVHRNDLNANFAAVEADINAQKNRVDELITGTPQPSEVVDSRGGFPVLGERLNDLSSSLTQNETKLDFLNGLKLKFVYGAIGDGFSHPLSEKYSTLTAAKAKYPVATALTDEIDWCAIQQMYNDAPNNSMVYIPTPPVRYRINKTLQINRNSVGLRGESKNVEIQHYGAGAGIKISAWNVTLENINAIGNGGILGSGGTSEYGIHLDGNNGSEFTPGVNRFVLRNVKASKHTKHGIFMTGGVWIGIMDYCEIEYNGLDGLNAVGDGALEQNGNALTVIGGSYSGNGRHGILWSASSLLALGINAETNYNSGICIQGIGLSASIIGGYIEDNRQSQVLFNSTYGGIVATLQDVFINSPYEGSDGGNSLIKSIGSYSQDIKLLNNTYSISGSKVQYFGDFGNLLSNGSTINYSEAYGSISSKFINIGKAKIITSPRDIMLIGKYSAKGNILYSSLSYSDNFFGVSDKSVEFIIPVTEQDIISSVILFATSNSTSQITVTMKIKSIYLSGGITEITETTSFTGETSLVIPLTNPFRVDSLSGCVLSLSFTNPSNGNSLIIGNPIIQVV